MSSRLPVSLPPPDRQDGRVKVTVQTSPSNQRKPRHRVKVGRPYGNGATSAKTQGRSSHSSSTVCKAHTSSRGDETKDDSLEMIRECLEAFLRTVVAGGLSGSYQLEPKTIAHWSNLVAASGGNWLGVAKYKRDAFLAAHYCNPAMGIFIEQPPKPFPDDVRDEPKRLFNGPLHKALDGIVRYRARMSEAAIERKFAMLQTLCSVKLICPRPNKQILEDKLKGTISKLTTATDDPDHVLIDAAPDEWPINRTRYYDWDDGCEDDNEDHDYRFGELPYLLRYHHRRTAISQGLFRLVVRNVLQQVVSLRHWNDGECMYKVFFPPTRANYEYSIAKGGGVTGFCQSPDVNLSEYRQPGGLLPVMIEKQGDSEPYGPVMFQFGKADLERQDFVWSECLARIRDSLDAKLPRLSAVALAEPLKVRIITKGPWESFMALRNLQQFLASELKHHPSFVLTGTPVTQEIISSLGPLRPGEKFLNGDYTAATDNLKSWTSRIYVEELSRHLNLDEQISTMLLNGMVNNLIEDENKVLQEQKCGQPMGFNNSFVGLCICNSALALLIRAWDSHGGVHHAINIELKDARVLINGDDIVMPITDDAYEIWKQVGAWMGLSPSVGKTYLSSEFAQINSRNFLYKNGTYKFVPGLNMGLLEGAAKKGAHVNDMPLACALSQLANNYRQLMKDAPTIAEKQRIHNLFMNIHSKRISEVSLPWYVPTWAGGLGFTGLYMPSELDRRVMHEIRLNFKKYNPRYLPVLEDAGTGEPDKTWYVHQIASERLPPPERSPDDSLAGIAAYTQAVGRMSVDILFDANVDIGSLFKASSVAKKATRNLRYNERLWNRLRIKALPSPLKFKECIERTYYEYYPQRYEYYSPLDDTMESIPVLPRVVEYDDECPDGYLLR